MKRMVLFTMIIPMLIVASLAFLTGCDSEDNRPPEITAVYAHNTHSTGSVTMSVYTSAEPDSGVIALQAADQEQAPLLSAILTMLMDGRANKLTLTRAQFDTVGIIQVYEHGELVDEVVITDPIVHLQ